MPTPLFRYSHKGAARKAVLTVALGGTTGDVTVTADDLTGWPTGASSRPFVGVINRGTATEEKILFASRSGNVLTVQTVTLNGRGWDDTTITSHGINDTLEHVWTSTEGEDLAAHIAAASGVHGVTGSVVGTSDTQTLTGKTISGATNTLSGIPQSAVTNLASDIATLQSGKADRLKEPIVDVTISAGVSACNLTLSNLFYVTTALSGNFVVNFTNPVTTDGFVTTVTVLCTQGATPYYPSAVQISGAAQTLRWANGTAPTPGANTKLDAYSFSLVRRGGTWTVIGTAVVGF